MTDQNIKQNFDIVVIGGGPAGVTAALRARELDASVALIEGAALGGVCTNDGCVPTRVLAKAARLRRDAQQFEKYGLIGDVPDVDFSRLMQRTQHIVYKMHEKKQLFDHLHQAGASVFTNIGRVRFSDPHTLEFADGTHVQGTKFIICTGGHSSRLSFPGSEYTLTHSDVWSLRRLPRSVAIVGAGGTGCQLASILVSFGTQVWLLNRDPHILPSEDRLVSDVMAQSFRQRGIQVLTGVHTERIDKSEEGLTLFIRQDDEPQSLAVEAVVVAVAWTGNVDDLGLAAAGVKTGNGHIVVNDLMQSSAEHIFAAGDVTGRMMLVQSAGYEGRLAAENAILGPGQPYRHQIVPHGGFTDPEYAGVGLTQEQAQAREACVAVAVPFTDVDRAVIDDHTAGFCKLIVSQESHRILGAHIVGEQALEAIQLVAAGMAADIWVEQMAELELAYPTYTAIVGLVARQICQKLGVVPIASKWRSLGKLPNAEWEWTDA